MPDALRDALPSYPARQICGPPRHPMEAEESAGTIYVDEGRSISEVVKDTRHPKYASVGRITGSQMIANLQSGTEETLEKTLEERRKLRKALKEQYLACAMDNDKL